MNTRQKIYAKTVQITNDLKYVRDIEKRLAAVENKKRKIYLEGQRDKLKHGRRSTLREFRDELFIFMNDIDRLREQLKKIKRKVKHSDQLTPPTHPSTHPSAHPSTHSPTYPSIHITDIKQATIRTKTHTNIETGTDTPVDQHADQPDNLGRLADIEECIKKYESAMDIYHDNVI